MHWFYTPATAGQYRHGVPLSLWYLNGTLERLIETVGSGHHSVSLAQRQSDPLLIGIDRVSTTLGDAKRRTTIDVIDFHEDRLLGSKFHRMFVLPGFMEPKMRIRKTQLKIKIKSLGEEAKIIKQEEAKWKATPFLVNNEKVTHPLFFSLQEHRLLVVRTECRASNIAYGYLRGRAYREIENKCHEQPNWGRVEAIILKFTGNAFFDVKDRKKLHEDLKAWATVEPEPVEDAVDEEAEANSDMLEVVMAGIGAFLFG